MKNSVVKKNIGPLKTHDKSDEVLEFETLCKTNRGTTIHATVVYPKENPENYLDEISQTLGYLRVFD